MRHIARIFIEGEIYDLAKLVIGHAIAAALAAHLVTGMPAQTVATVATVASVEVK